MADAGGPPRSYRWKRHNQRVVSRDGENDFPEPATPAIAENLVQQTQEEQMLREAMALLTPQCRRLVELLFFENSLAALCGSRGRTWPRCRLYRFTRQKCLERLRRQLEELGFL